MKKFMTMLAIITCLTEITRPSEQVKSSESEVYDNSVILMWDEAAYNAFGGKAYQHSLMASRINAMMHLAIHDALNAIRPMYATYVYRGRDEKADPMVAVASAAHTVLVSEIPAKENYLDSLFQQFLSMVNNEEARNRGIKLGVDAARAVLSSRTNDGSQGNPMIPINESNILGEYQPVPPYNFIFAPFWQDVRLFGLQSKDQFRCTPLPAISSKEYTDAFNEVKEMGRKNSMKRSPDQTEFTHFWYEFSEAGWNRIARIVADKMDLNLYETARLFALVDMSIADTYIASWESKVFYNSWRPYTAIRKAAEDGNPSTMPESGWEPEMVTPPVQDYPSTHAALGNAAAAVMASLLGDQVSFTMNSPTALQQGKARSFNSFSQAARENADSRVMAGIHFRFACNAGLEMGEEVGQYIVANYLKPVQ